MKLGGLQRTAQVLTLVGAAWLVGCSGCEPDPAADPSVNGEGENSENSETGEGSETEPRESHIGRVIGVVRLADGAELPSYLAEQLLGPHSRVGWSENCSPPRGSDRTPVQMGPGEGSRGLAGMVISATGDQETFFAALPEAEPQTHELVIDDCRLSPRVVSVALGDTLNVRQDTALEAFMPVIGEGAFMEVLPYHQTREFTIEQGGLSVLTCAFSTPCLRTDIVAHYHPVHTTSGEGGAFVLNNVPADQPVQIHAWHPLFEDVMVETSVAEDGEVQVTLIVTPAEVPTAAEEETPSEPGDGETETPELF